MIINDWEILCDCAGQCTFMIKRIINTCIQLNGVVSVLHFYHFCFVDLSLFAYEKNCLINSISCRAILICLDQLRDFSNLKSRVLIAVQLVLIYCMVCSIISVYFSVLWFVRTLVTPSQMPNWTVLVQMFESKGNFPFMPTKAQPVL